MRCAFLIFPFLAIIFSNSAAGSAAQNLDCSKVPTDIQLLQKYADEGSIDASLSLAEAYLSGDEVKQDASEALKWYRASAKMGSVFAEILLGDIYSDKWNLNYPPVKMPAEKIIKDTNVAVDYVEAAKWIKMAAERGDPGAQYQLGRAYRDGVGVKQDYTEAWFWMVLGKAFSDSPEVGGTYCFYGGLPTAGPLPKSSAEIRAAEIRSVENNLTTVQMLKNKIRKKYWHPLKGRPLDEKTTLLNIDAMACGKTSKLCHRKSECGKQAICHIKNTCGKYVEVVCGEGLSFLFIDKNTREILGNSWGRYEFTAAPKNWKCKSSD